MHLRHLVLAGAILASAMPAAAQGTLARLVLAPKPPRASAALPRVEFGRREFTTPWQLRRNGGSFSLRASSVVPASSLLPSTYTREIELPVLPKLQQTNTLFMTQARLPVAAFGSGRVQLAGFGSTLVMGNVELGPSGSGGLLDFHPYRHYQPGDPRSVESYGLSLAFHLGRNSEAAHPTEIWRTINRLIDDAR